MMDNWENFDNSENPEDYDSFYDSYYGGFYPDEYEDEEDEGYSWSDEFDWDDENTESDLTWS